MPTGKYMWIKKQVTSAFELRQMSTIIGARRIADWSIGEPLPRIC